MNAVEAMARDAAWIMARLGALGGARGIAGALYGVTVVPEDAEAPGFLVEPPSRPGGRAEAAAVPLPELRAAG